MIQFLKVFPSRWFISYCSFGCWHNVLCFKRYDQENFSLFWAMVKITKLKSCLTQANVGRKLLKLLFCVNINSPPMSGSGNLQMWWKHCNWCYESIEWVNSYWVLQPLYNLFRVAGTNFRWLWEKVISVKQVASIKKCPQFNKIVFILCTN